MAVFLLRDAKPAFRPAAEKSWRRTLRDQDRGGARVAGLRSDQINRVRGGRGLVSGKMEIMSWLQSISAFSSRTDNGFAGSLADKPLTLDVKALKFLADRHGATTGTVPASASPFAGTTEFGAAWKKPSCPATAIPAFRSSWAIPPSLLRYSDAAWSRRRRRIWCCHLFTAAVPSSRTGHRSRLVEAWLFRANVRRRHPLRQGS